MVHTIFEVKDGKTRTFRGNYSDYRATLEAERALTREKTSTPKKAAPKKSPEKTAKARNPWRLERLENAIIALESARLELLESLGKEEIYKDPDATRDVQVRLAELERDLEEKNAEWERYV